jgi:hypothetical protein
VINPIRNSKLSMRKLSSQLGIQISTQTKTCEYNVIITKPDPNGRQAWCCCLFLALKMIIKNFTWLSFYFLQWYLSIWRHSVFYVNIRKSEKNCLTFEDISIFTNSLSTLRIGGHFTIEFSGKFTGVCTVIRWLQTKAK